MFDTGHLQTDKIRCKLVKQNIKKLSNKTNEKRSFTVC